MTSKTWVHATAWGMTIALLIIGIMGILGGVKDAQISGLDSDNIFITIFGFVFAYIGYGILNRIKIAKKNGTW